MNQFGLFEFYQVDSPLHRRNPVVKLLALGVVMIVIMLDLRPSTRWFDPGVPLVFLALLVLTTSLLGNIPLSAIVKRLLGFSLLTLPLLVFTALYFDPAQAANPVLLGSFGIWNLYLQGLISGAALAIRMLAFIACSMAFVMTTDPSDFAISLIRQLKVPYRFGYAILVSYRFLPILRTEFDTIRAAHSIRGVGESPGLGGQLRQLQRYAIPLLAAAIRKAERTAVAMDSRGFGGAESRTYYRQTAITPLDWAFLLTVVGLTLVLLDVLFLAGMIDGLGLIPGA